MSESCSGQCSNCNAHSAATETKKAKQPLASIKHKIMVLSGKGGVGKSSVAVNLAAALSKQGKRVGLLDIDFHGPSIPTMLGLQNASHPPIQGDKLKPHEAHGIKVLSIAFLLDSKDKAVIWRGPMKAGVIKQLFEDVAWGELDYLIMDFPPGTGDEALSACNLVCDAEGGIIVTTPQEVSLADCRRCINFCNQVSLPVLGVIENMSGLVCPACDHSFSLFKPGGGETMANEMRVPFLGRLPLDPRLAESCDAGTPFVLQYPDAAVALAFAQVIQTLPSQATD